jgi:hypothetical protein
MSVISYQKISKVYKLNNEKWIKKLKNIKILIIFNVCDGRDLGTDKGRSLHRRLEFALLYMIIVPANGGAGWKFEKILQFIWISKVWP